MNNLLELFTTLDKNGAKNSEIDQIKKLERVSLLVFFILTLIIIISSTVILNLDSTTMMSLKCVVSGITGSATAALLSALQRRAAGWELNVTDNTTDKKGEKRLELFSQKMAPFFLFRPFLGIIAGLIVFYGVMITIFEMYTTELDYSLHYLFFEYLVYY